MPRLAAWDKAKEDSGKVPVLRPGGGSVRFSVNLKPPSVNTLYQIIFNQRRVITHPKYALFKTKFKQQVPQIKVEADKLAIILAVHMDWYHGNGKLKKLDVQNLEKAVIDCVFERLGVDDSKLWWVHSRKVQSEMDRIDIRMFAIG